MKRLVAAIAAILALAWWLRREPVARATWEAWERSSDAGASQFIDPEWAEIEEALG